MTEKLSEIKNSTLYIVLFVVTTLIVLGATFFYGKELEDIEKIVVVMILCSGINIFLLADTTGSNGFKYQNLKKQWRFVFCYIAILIVAVALPLISNGAWPFMAFFVLLSLFSNSLIGIVSSSTLLVLSVMLEQNGGYSEFFIYFLSGCLAVVLLDDLQKTQDVGWPIFISLLMQFVLFVAFNILFENKTFTWVSLIVPIVCTIIDAIILLVTLGAFSQYIIRGTTDMYMDINDPEYSLLVQIKEKDKDEYYKAIHTAYLAERASMKLELNSRAVKTCSYYHRISVLSEGKSWDDVLHYFKDNEFPDEVIPFLNEFYNPRSKSGFVSREATVVNICETVVSSIMYLIRKDKDSKIDYDELIDKIIQHKLDKKEFNRSKLSFSDLENLRKLLKKEKLYYDFLR